MAHSNVHILERHDPGRARRAARIRVDQNVEPAPHADQQVGPVAEEDRRTHTRARALVERAAHLIGNERRIAVQRGIAVAPDHHGIGRRHLGRLLELPAHLGVGHVGQPPDVGIVDRHLGLEAHDVRPRRRQAVRAARHAADAARRGNARRLVAGARAVQRRQVDRQRQHRRQIRAHERLDVDARLHEKAPTVVGISADGLGCQRHLAQRLLALRRCAILGHPVGRSTGRLRRNRHVTLQIGQHRRAGRPHHHAVAQEFDEGGGQHIRGHRIAAGVVRTRRQVAALHVGHAVAGAHPVHRHKEALRVAAKLPRHRVGCLLLQIGATPVLACQRTDGAQQAVLAQVGLAHADIAIGLRSRALCAHRFDLLFALQLGLAAVETGLQLLGPLDQLVDLLAILAALVEPLRLGHRCVALLAQLRQLPAHLDNLLVHHSLLSCLSQLHQP